MDHHNFPTAPALLSPACAATLAGCGDPPLSGRRPPPAPAQASYLEVPYIKFLSGILAMAIAWLLSGGNAFGQISHLPIGNTNELEAYYLTQVRQVEIGIGLADDFGGDSGILYAYTPTNEADLVSFARGKIRSACDPLSPDYQWWFNVYPTNKWAVWVGADTETFFVNGFPFGSLSRLLMSSPSHNPTNRVFGLVQSGTNWVPDHDVASEIDFSYVNTDEVFIRVPGLQGVEIDLTRGWRPSKLVGADWGSGQWTNGINQIYMDLTNQNFGLSPWYLFGKAQGTAKIRLKDAGGNPIEQDFDLATGNLVSTSYINLMVGKPHLTDSGIQILLFGSAGASIVVETSTDLIAWHQAGTIALGSDGTALFGYTNTSPLAFYRARAP